MNNIKTELDFERERDNQEFSAFFWPNLLLAIGIGLVCSLGVILTILNSEFIDSIKPEYQLAIFAVSCGAFGTFRFVIWIKDKL